MSRESFLRFGVPLTVALLAQTSCGSGDDNPPCPFCPATFLTVGVLVTSAMDGGTLAGVQATLTGSETTILSCEPRGTAVFCTLPPVAPGSYSLQVTALGFRPTNVSASVTITRDPRCGCSGATVEPSEVTLDPS